MWQRIRVDLARPEGPTARDELAFAMVAPIVVVAIAQFTDPAPPATLLLLIPAIVAFALRPLCRYPAELFALVVIASVGITVGIDGDLESVLFLPTIMVLYTAWNLGSLLRAKLITVLAAAMPWFVAEVMAPDSGITWWPWTTAAIFMFSLGRALHAQRTLIAELEAARQSLADQAVAEERRRIARELHDLAGHTLAAMVLHVTGARHVLRRNMDEAEAALRDAEAVGRSSLDQIRLTVAALRTHERGTDPVLRDSTDLPTLVEGYRRAGLSIDAHLPSRDAAIDGPVGVAIHRIAREALANVARHAPANRVELQVSTTPDSVQLVIRDHGKPAPVPDAHQPHFGIIGMTERARALGGEIDAGPTPDGWRVAVQLPLATRNR